MSALDSILETVHRMTSDSSMQATDALWLLLADESQARVELAALRSELDDWRNSARMVSGEMCGDEKHCTCVPLLRNRIAKLEAALAKADEVEAASANVGHCIGCAEFQDCDVHLLYNPRLAYRTAREAAK